MKKSFLFLFVTGAIFFAFIGSAIAVPVLYDVTSGQDQDGYDLSGYVVIDDSYIIGYTSGTDEPASLTYHITDFKFSSLTGEYEGTNGRFEWLFFPSDFLPEKAGMLDLSHGHAEFSGEPRTWGNEETGIYFEGATEYYEDYLTLPETIWISTYHMGCEWEMPLLDYYPTGNITLTRHQDPVPEPSTMLLLFSGVASLAAFRRKNRHAA